MGSGKGSPEWWVANVKPGRVLFELSGVPNEPIAREAMRRAIHKLPMKCRIVTREGVSLMAAGTDRSELRELSDDELVARAARGQGGAVQPPLPGRPPASWTTTGGCRPSASDIARIYTIMRERELGLSAAPDEGDWHEREPRPTSHRARSRRAAAARSARASWSATRWTRPSSSRSRTGSSTRCYGKVIRRTSKLKAHDEQNDVRHRRPGADHGDPAAVGHQALAGRRDPREGQVAASRQARRENWQTWSRRDPAGVATARRRQHRCQGDPVHPGARRLRPALRRASATSSSPRSRTPSRVPA